MKKYVVVLVATMLAVLAVGCGGVAEETGPEPSETPDAVAGDTASAEATGGDTEAKISGAGFSVDEYGSVGYGLVIRNTSETEDAFDLAITVNCLDKNGNVIATDSGVLSLIPAGKTFYYGGEVFEAKRTVKLEAFADVGSSAPAKYTLPEAKNVRAEKSSYSTGTRVRGQVKNTHDAPLSSFARICSVLFDKNGKVIGGGFGFLDGDLPPGRTAAFELISGTMCTPYSKVAKAMCSVENKFDLSE